MHEASTWLSLWVHAPLEHSHSVMSNPGLHEETTCKRSGNDSCKDLSLHAASIARHVCERAFR